MDKTQYLAALHENFESMVDAARKDPDAQVPACPAWDVEGLMGHMLLVYSNWESKVRKRQQEDSDLNEEDLAMYPGYVAWVESDFSPKKRPADALSWLIGRERELETALATADPEERVKTWFPPDQTAGFVQRRMAQETAVHRWDAQSATGSAQPIDRELAADGIDEMLDVHLTVRREWEEPRASAGERFHFHQTDGDGEWLIEFAPEGPRVSREHGKGDVAVRGTASDLLLFLWGRVPAGSLEVHGDANLLDRWFELVPAD
ncbi:MAG: maleylpyruvate isomerase family mycothiol-dependent enzyme [Chloroflexota bacterium]